MAYSYSRDREEFLWLLARPVPIPLAGFEDTLKIMRLATAHLRLCVRSCSDPAWDDDRDERRLERVEAALRALAGERTLTIQRDPRGATVRLDGVAVPQRDYPARVYQHWRSR